MKITNNIKKPADSAYSLLFVSVALLIFHIILNPFSETIKNIFIFSLSLTMFFTMLSLSSTFFTGIHLIVNAKWSENLITILRPIQRLLPYLMYCWLISIALSGKSILFPEKIASLKDFYFHPFFIFLRTFCFLIVWIKISDIQYNNYRKAIFSFIIIIFTYCHLVYDWLLSISALHEISLFTMIMIINSLQIGLAFIFLIVNNRNIRLENSIKNDLRKYSITLVLAWLYLSFSYLLIGWYSMQNHESSFYHYLFNSNLLILFILNLTANFILPFTILISNHLFSKFKMALLLSFSIFIGKFTEVILLLTTAFKVDFYRNIFGILAFLFAGFFFLKLFIKFYQTVEK